MRDPLDGSSWSSANTVAGFSQSAPNDVLMRYAAAELPRAKTALLLDIGCGAARNAAPLAAMGWRVLGVDLSWPMLRAAAERARAENVDARVSFALAPMDALPVRDRSMDVAVAHGIWNLAESAGQFRKALQEAARALRPGAGLFVFTFSRNTLAPDAEPVPGESFVFTQFSGRPQCFLTEAQLVSEFAAAGLTPDPLVPITEYNRPARGALRTGGPVIYEAAFRMGSDW
jgi:2-polyprenyl-6-hydroxyphenyl methylase/3-demethylubiquinone-9 3-methyltransferase